MASSLTNCEASAVSQVPPAQGPNVFTPSQLSSVRQLFPYTSSGRIYLNHAATAPLSTPVVEAMRRNLQERSSGKLETYSDDILMIAELRERVARLIGAESTARIALQANTSDAICVVATGLPWRSGDRILLNRAEFPANVHPFLNMRRHGVEIDMIDAPDGVVTPEALRDAIRPRTRLLALSAVQFLSGFRADLASIGALCTERGIVFVVDGIQAVGAVRINVVEMKIDALAAGCQKWQLGPQGAGFLYVTDQLQEEIQQAYLGWLAVEDPWKFFDFEQGPAPSARRYEGGTLPIPSLWGMHAALGMLLETGPAAIEERLLALTGGLIDAFERAGLELMTPAEPARRAGIVTLRLRAALNGRALMKDLARRGLIASIREGSLRLSPHFYNTDEEMHRAAGTVLECVRAAREGV
jgi:cysteine desulfurase/selenocysteine lyase